MDKVDKVQLMQFSINNKLEILKAKINKFNPLKILKVEDYEIRHSNIISWLLDPNENHNLDDRILKRFILEISLSADNENVSLNGFDRYQFLKCNVNDIKVYRERNNIDILIISESQKLAIVIENKLYSNEHSNQLVRYFDSVYKNYDGYTIIPVFLTLDGTMPSSEKYLVASYKDLIDVVSFVLDNYKERTSNDVVNFIQYFISIVKEKLIMDDELRRLCKEIYFENRDVINLIYQVGNDIDLEPAGKRFIETNTELHYIETSNPKQFWYIHDDFKLSKLMSSGWATGYPFCYWFNFYGDELKIILEVGPFDNGHERVKFLEHLEQNGLYIQNRAKDINRKYTRLFTNKIRIKDWTDEEELFDKMNVLYSDSKLRKIHDALVSSINQFNWS